MSEESKGSRKIPPAIVGIVVVVVVIVVGVIGWAFTRPKPESGKEAVAPEASQEMQEMMEKGGDLGGGDQGAVEPE